ncbi:MAG: glycosyltransferase family 4 protein [Bacteroidales bacterium]|nr:glycosyltransferase family 4 protein [Bacteroidales bacterium]
MKVLFLCNKSPYPPKEGGSLAMYNIICGLLEKSIDIKILAVSTQKCFVNKDEIPKEFSEPTNFDSYFIDTNPDLWDAFLNLFSTKSYQIERFYNKGFDKKLQDILAGEKFDIVQLESVYMTPYVDTIRKNSSASIVLRAHNIEHIIWNRIVKNEKNPLKKWYLQLQSRRLKKYETLMTGVYDGIAAITDIDADFYRKINRNIPVCTIPFGVVQKNINFNVIQREERSVFFLGSLNWMPNIEGLNWFLNHVWPQVIARDNTLKLYIAGRQAPNHLKEYRKNNVHYIGEVEDALGFMASKSIMVVPLFSGSGMRVKIIEGMMAANTIISTHIGAEGIEYKENENIFIADTVEAFVNAILRCTSDKTLCETTGENARKLIHDKYMNERIIENLLNFYQKISSIKAEKKD